MVDYRWNSPFNYTIAFELFHKHFTEINDTYWANNIASSTVESMALKSGVKPLEFFLVHDEDDIRVPENMEEWKERYREFQNYNRLNTLMILSSSFETYLRTVVSLSLESKPGVIIKSKDSVDGAILLINNYSYGNSRHKDYLFNENINGICSGDWNKRITVYESLFEYAPPILHEKVEELDEFRRKRNLVGHYIGRKKEEYETPLFLDTSPAERVSHKKIIKYLGLIFDVTQAIDKQLKAEYIGSYDLIKYYCYCNNNGLFKKETFGEKGQEYRKIIGRAGKQPVGAEYYKWIAHFVENASHV